MGGAKLAN